MAIDLISKKASTDNTCDESIHETGGPMVQFEDLPLDVLYTIVSKLAAKEFARTSVLSSKWRHMWKMCPILTFDGVILCKCSRDDLNQHIGTFINKVNSVVQKYHGKVVETLEIRIDFLNSLLVHHLNNWVAFAVASRTKNLILDLKPEWFRWDKDRYVFPFGLLDCGSISRLRNMKLSFVSMKLPDGFRGFPNLTKLHIQLMYVNRKDLESMLSHCYNLEWLHIDRCDLNDELIVNGPLSRLLYLRFEHGKFTKIKFHAVNLATFEYEGYFTLFDLSHSTKLKNANIKLDGSVLQHVLVSLLHGLQHVQNLTLHLGLAYLEKQWLWDNPLKFSYLRNLHLLMILSGYFWLADVGPRRSSIGQCKYNHLKKLCITEFQAGRGQLEFILHVVENAPALEIVIVEVSKSFYGKGKPPSEEAKQIAVTSLSTTLPQNVNFEVI